MYILKKAVKQINKTTKGDRGSARKILEKIERYAESPELSFDIKILKGKFEDIKRLRVGNDRVLFIEDKSKVYVLNIKHRQEAYDD